MKKISKILAQADADRPLVAINASDFQSELATASERMVQKLDREFRTLIVTAPFNAKEYVATDLIAIFRQAICTKNLLFYLHSDERRNNDPDWRESYTFACLPLVRTIIDDLYNTIRIINDPHANGTLFRRAGYNKAFRALEEQEALHGDDQARVKHLQLKKHRLLVAMVEDGIALKSLSKKDKWDTLSAYLREAAKKSDEASAFLKGFIHGDWAQYSAMAHGGFEGLMETAGFFTRDFFDVRIREIQDARYPGEMTRHVMRAATLILCILTELKARFEIKDEQLDTNIHNLWETMRIDLNTNKLYLGRYQDLISKSYMVKVVIFRKQ